MRAISLLLFVLAVKILFKKSYPIEAVSVRHLYDVNRREEEEEVGKEGGRQV